MAGKEAEQLIQKGVAAIRSGQRERGRELLQLAVRNDPRNARAWLWLSAVSEGIDAQRQCLYKVLEIEPNNSIARSGLAFLSRLRVGEEGRAAAAPWIMGLEEESGPTRPCPRCQTQNPTWAYTCSGCGAVLQVIDIVETAKTELHVEGRSPAAPAVMLSWPSALALDRPRTFEPEVEHASLMRSLTALLLGALFLVLLRAGLTVAAVLLAGRQVLPLLWPLARAAALAGGGILVAAAAVTLAAALLTFPSSRLMGGKGGLLVHLHLVAVGVSSWLAAAAMAALVAWGLSFVLGGETLALVRSAFVALLALYGLILLIQAVQTAQSIHPVLATISVAVAVAVGVLVYLGLGHGLADVLDVLRRLGNALLTPL